MVEVFTSAVFVTEVFASLLILEVVFKSPAVTEAYVKPVTAFASPVRVTGVFGTSL